MSSPSPTLGQEVQEQPPPDLLTPQPTLSATRGALLEGGSIPPSLLGSQRLVLGDFFISPQASLNAVYDDNIEADKNDRQEDIFVAFSPSVRAQSRYARHSIGLNASATAATAIKNASEDVLDWRVGADSRVDITRQTKLDAAVNYTRETLDSADIDAEEDEDDPTVNVISGAATYRTGGSTIGWQAGSSLSRLEFEGGAFDDRDRTTLGLDAGVNYVLSDRVSISAGPNYSYSSFDEEEADDGDSRDAHTVGAEVGAAYKISRTIDSSAAIGYSAAYFEDPDRDNTSGATGRADLVWTIRRATSLRLAATRSLDLSVIDDEDARITTTATASLSHTHFIGRYSSLSPSLSASYSRFSDLDRNDQNLAATLDYARRMSANVFFNAGYKFSRRFSDDDDAEFYRHLVLMGITVAY